MSKDTQCDRCGTPAHPHYDMDGRHACCCDCRDVLEEQARAELAEARLKRCVELLKTVAASGLVPNWVNTGASVRDVLDEAEKEGWCK